jgi:hypothetical protein
MKIALLAMLLAVSAYSQEKNALISQACGPMNVNFDVNLNYSLQTPTRPESEKSIVYFIQDSGLPNHALFGQVSRIGLDGAWVGANKNNSYFSLSVAPGEHHLCMHMQGIGHGNQIELLHLYAEPGKVYYFRTRHILSGNANFIEIAPVDSDQARYLIASFPLSLSKPSK